MNISKLMIFMLLNCYVFISCKQEKRGYVYYYKNGNVKEVHTTDLNNADIEIIICFYETGEIKQILRKNKEGKLHGEQLWFYKTGVLDRKILIANHEINGNAYYFYKENGALKSDRYFKNDTQVSYGADYWGDSLGTIKSSLHFNDNGEIYYKKNFDINGKLISEEGHR